MIDTELSNRKWIPLCGESELPPGEMRGFDVGGLPPVAVQSARRLYSRHQQYLRTTWQF